MRPSREPRRLLPAAAAVALCLVAAACSLSGGSGGAPATASPARSSPSLPAAGCGATPANQPAPPDWTAAADPPTYLPIVMSEEGNVAAFVFGAPLHVVQMANGLSDKILWIVREPRNGQPLHVTGHPLDASTPQVSYTFAADSGPGEIYPVDVPVPVAGCWHFTLAWGPNSAHIDLAYIQGG